MRKWTALFLTVVILLSGCGSGKEAGQMQPSDGTAWAEQEETAAFTVNGEEIGLREWNFYVRMNQMQWEKAYLEECGDGMWSQTEEDGTTWADSLKEEVFETICQLHLMNQWADEHEINLSEEALQDVSERSSEFMKAYNEALLDYAGADETFIYERLQERERADLAIETLASECEPKIPEEDYHREGICYVLISTTGLRDEEGNLTPFTDEEVERRTQLAFSLSEKAKASGSLKTDAEAEGLTPIEYSVGKTNDYEVREHRMLDAARALSAGEVSDPVETEEGWFIVQHTNDYDEDGTAYWKTYLEDLAREEYYQKQYEQMREAADIRRNQEIMDQVNVKIVLKELL